MQQVGSNQNDLNVISKIESTFGVSEKRKSLFLVRLSWFHCVGYPSVKRSSLRRETVEKGHQTSSEAFKSSCQILIGELNRCQFSPGVAGFSFARTPIDTQIHFDRHQTNRPRETGSDENVSKYLLVILIRQKHMEQKHVEYSNLVSLESVYRDGQESANILPIIKSSLIINSTIDSGWERWISVLFFQSPFISC